MSLYDIGQFYARLVAAKGGSKDERLIRTFTVRSADETAWLASDGWWFSTSEP